MRSQGCIGSPKVTHNAKRALWAALLAGDEDLSS
jgi:hypothetical protein